MLEMRGSPTGEKGGEGRETDLHERGSQEPGGYRHLSASLAEDGASEQLTVSALPSSESDALGGQH